MFEKEQKEGFWKYDTVREGILQTLTLYRNERN